MLPSQDDLETQIDLETHIHILLIKAQEIKKNMEIGKDRISLLQIPSPVTIFFELCLLEMDLNKNSPEWILEFSIKVNAYLRHLMGNGYYNHLKGN